MSKPVTVLRNELASLLLMLQDRDVARVITVARRLVGDAKAGRRYGEALDDLAHALERMDGRGR